MSSKFSHVHSHSSPMSVGLCRIVGVRTMQTRGPRVGAEIEEWKLGIQRIRDSGSGFENITTSTPIPILEILGKHWHIPGHVCLHAKSFQSCMTLCNTMDWSLPCSSVHGILQARILEWVAIASSRSSSEFRDGTHISYFSCIGKWILYH